MLKETEAENEAELKTKKKHTKTRQTDNLGSTASAMFTYRVHRTLQTTVIQIY
jgi:hypothetical protein